MLPASEEHLLTLNAGIILTLARNKALTLLNMYRWCEWGQKSDRKLNIAFQMSYVVGIQDFFVQFILKWYLLTQSGIEASPILV